MNRRHGGRDRRQNYGGGDGLLGEGPGFGGGMFEPMVNSQMNQLMLAQQLLQQQALGGSGGYAGGEMGAIGALAGAMGNMQFLQHQQGMGYGGGLGMRNDRKRVGGQSRDTDFKRRRRDSSGRGGDRDRSRGRDGNRSGDGRDRNHSSRSDSDKDKNRKEQDYDPADPTEDEEAKDKESGLYCHVCNVSVYDDESFRRHLNGTKHTQRMNSVLTVHQMKSNQLKSRLKAEEHLRKIEGKRGYDPNYFCKICNNSLTIPWDRHRFSNIHKQRQLQVKRGCGWCNVHDFNNFTEVLEHRETEEHKKNAELYGKKKEEQEDDRSRSRSRERRSEKHRRGSWSRDESRKDRKLRDKKREEDEEDLTIPEFNAENAVGVNYIIPVTGFFCKLCHKFYNNEKSAKEGHCQTEAHYQKFKVATEEKIAEREKRRAEEAAEEAEKKTKEEAKKESREGTSETDMEDKEAGDGNKEKHEEDEFDENYDDPLPLEDEDNDGGLAKDDEFDVLEDEANATVSDVDLNDSSSALLSGDMAETETDGQHKDEQMDVSDVAQIDGENVTVESGSIVQEEETSSANVEDDDEAALSTATSETQKTPGRGRGTARRGRGRGKAKK